MGFVVLGVILLVFVALAGWDRRARRQGHRFRKAGDIWRSERDVHRNIRAANSTWANPTDPDWSKPDDQRGKH